MSAPDPTDRTVFFLDDPEWVEFNARLNCPVEPKPRLARLLTGPANWGDEASQLPGSQFA